MKKLLCAILLFATIATAQPSSQTQDFISFPKLSILSGLQATYPGVFDSYQVADLEAYGRWDQDSSFTFMRFKAVPIDSAHSQKKWFFFPRGQLLALLSGLAPEYFAGRTDEQLQSFFDDPADSTKILFTFKPE